MTESDSSEGIAARWISYRPEIKIMDCTIRDGGLMNDHRFDDRTVRAVYEACVEGGIDSMEIGYKNSRRLFPPDEFGPWKHSCEEDIRRIVGENDTPLKLSVMADAEKCDYQEDILPREQSVLDIIRVATYIHQLPLALEMVQDAHDKGYETCLNLMAVSIVRDRELDEALAMVAESEVDAVAVVDSFGALYSEQIHFLVEKYLSYAKPAGKQVGIHAHNNQQLAFANTIEATIKGANLLDASLAGLGRGAGNCLMELLIGFLHNPKYRMRPLLKCIQEHIEPMQAALKWGYDTPYMITGCLNEHPRAGIEFKAADTPGDILDFYDSMQEQE